jgi:segregation and condensation protein B
VSRKRKHRNRREEAPVADEILAEGSGPHEVPAAAVAMTIEDIAEVVVAADDEPVLEAAAPGDELPSIEPLADPELTDELDGDAPVTDGPAVEAVVELAPEDDAADDPAVGATLPTSAASMDEAQIKHLIEALVFASDKPLTVQRLRQLTRVSDTRRIEAALATLAEDYRDRGLILQSVSGGYQFRTRTQFSAWVQQLIAGRPVRLSRAQLETLAIIAYRQPITRPEIDDIRGVDSSGTLRVLMDRLLIRTLGKKEEVGRPVLYGTTKEFLDFFSLGDLRELPTLREYSELTAESRKVMSDRLGIELGGEAGEGGGAAVGGGAPVGDALVEDAPVGDAPVEDAPIGDAPSEEPPVEALAAAVPAEPGSTDEPAPEAPEAADAPAPDYGDLGFESPAQDLDENALTDAVEPSMVAEIVAHGDEPGEPALPDDEDDPHLE